MTVFLAGDVDLLFDLLVFLSGGQRETGRVGIDLVLPSDAMVCREFDFTLDVSLGGCLCGVAPVRRRKEAEGDRDSGVKVQVDDSSVREAHFSNAFRGTKGRQEGISCFCGG
jgi:hypothetical protein